MKETLLTLSPVLLLALYLFAFITGVRLIVRRTESLWPRALLILGMCLLLLAVSFVSWAAIYYARGGH